MKVCDGRRSTIWMATGNSGKLLEVQRFFLPLGIEVRGKEDFPVWQDVVEDGDSFLANARKKSRQLHQATGLPVLADDSGLEVDALHGAPGVFSARYAGANASDEENNLKLLRALADVPAHRRTARYRCVLVLTASHEREWTAEGVCEGVIAPSPRGCGGFGYDPLFLLPQMGGLSMAQLSAEEKQRISHRGEALRELVKEGLLAQLLSRSIS